MQAALSTPSHAGFGTPSLLRPCNTCRSHTSQWFTAALRSPLRSSPVCRADLPEGAHAAERCQHETSGAAFVLRQLAAVALSVSVSMGMCVPEAPALVQGFSPMEALKNKDYGKSRMTYSDYVSTPSGLQYSDLVEGKGASPKPGQSVTIDWDGYTIGYYGRPFEARNKTKGSAFTGDDKDFFIFRVGAGQVIPAFEEAILGMKVGGIRRLVVPQELGYPNNNIDTVGPRPSNFSGQRALLFVIQNQGMIDKTLLFDIELISIN